ncbi:PulJ/GspJ family protein [Desulfobacula sp.]
MSKSIKNRHDGFTLVELLVSVMIFSIIISTLFFSFKAFIISSERVKQDLTNSEKIKTVLKRINRDLESLFVVQAPRYKKPEFNSDPDPYRLIGEEVTVGQDIFSSIVFTSLAHTLLGLDQRTGVARIAYYLKGGGNDTYDLYRADSLLPFPEELESCYDPILCKGISKFEIVYTDSKGNNYRYWNSDDKEFKYTFPASIDLKIALGSGEKRQVYETTICIISGRASIE